MIKAILRRWSRCYPWSKRRLTVSRRMAPMMGLQPMRAVAAIAGDIEVIIPPRVSAVLNPAAEDLPSRRERHIVVREVIGRRRWQQFTGHTRRSRVETTMGRIPN